MCLENKISKSALSSKSWLLQWIKTLATKPGHMNSISRTHGNGRRKELIPANCPLSMYAHYCLHICTCIEM